MKKHTPSKAEAEAAQADYPHGFKQWAFWRVDLSLHAPSVDKQLAALLVKWQAQAPSAPGKSI